MTPKDRERCLRRPDRRRLSRPLRSQNPRRHPRAGRQRRGGRAASLRPSPACPRSISASIARSFSPGCGPGPMKASPNGCASSIRCACSTRCSRMPIRSCGRCCQCVEDVRENRQPVAKDNASGRRRSRSSDWIETSLDAYRDLRDHRREACSTRSMARPSCKPSSASRLPTQSPRRRPGKDAAHLALVAQRIEELKSRYREGRAARSGSPRPALHPHAGGRRRRARLQSASADAGRGRKGSYACGVQDSSCASSSSCCCSTSAAPSRQFRPCSTRIPILLPAWQAICSG